MDRYTSLMENKCTLMADDNSANQDYRSKKNGQKIKNIGTFQIGTILNAGKNFLKLNFQVQNFRQSLNR